MGCKKLPAKDVRATSIVMHRPCFSECVSASLNVANYKKKPLFYKEKKNAHLLCANIRVMHSHTLGSRVNASLECRAQH
jgi:hypothetical protein